MGIFLLVHGWFEAKNSTDPSPFSETAEPIKQKFTIPINTTSIEKKLKSFGDGAWRYIYIYIYIYNPTNKTKEYKNQLYLLQMSEMSI